MIVNEEAVKKILEEVKPAKLVAATKYVDVKEIEKLEKLGVTCFGENRVQAFLEKYENYHGNGEFQFIGTLQPNKVKYIIDKVAMIHSVDSLRLAQTMEQEAAKKDLVMPILLEVNVAEEESKFGLATNEVLPLLEKISIFSHIKVMGLMTIAPFVKNPEENREVFRTLKKLSVDINAKNINNVNMSVLSMGMTGDYQVAVQEGSTMVRVGTGIFGERNYATRQED